MISLQVHDNGLPHDRFSTAEPYPEISVVILLEQFLGFAIEIARPLLVSRSMTFLCLQ